MTTRQAEIITLFMGGFVLLFGLLAWAVSPAQAQATATPTPYTSIYTLTGFSTGNAYQRIADFDSTSSGSSTSISKTPNGSLAVEGYVSCQFAATVSGTTQRNVRMIVQVNGTQVYSSGYVSCGNGPSLGCQLSYDVTATMGTPSTAGAVYYSCEWQPDAFVTRTIHFDAVISQTGYQNEEAACNEEYVEFTAPADYTVNGTDEDGNTHAVSTDKSVKISIVDGTWGDGVSSYRRDLAVSFDDGDTWQSLDSLMEEPNTCAGGLTYDTPTYIFPASDSPMLIRVNDVDGGFANNTGSVDYQITTMLGAEGVNKCDGAYVLDGLMYDTQILGNNYNGNTHPAIPVVQPGFIPGNVYAIETYGGSWFDGSEPEPRVDLEYKFYGESTWRNLDQDNVCIAANGKIFIQLPKGDDAVDIEEPLIIRVNDSPPTTSSEFADNTGSISYKIYNTKSAFRPLKDADFEEYETYTAWYGYEPQQGEIFARVNTDDFLSTLFNGQPTCNKGMQVVGAYTRGVLTQQATGVSQTFTWPGGILYWRIFAKANHQVILPVGDAYVTMKIVGGPDDYLLASNQLISANTWTTLADSIDIPAGVYSIVLDRGGLSDNSDTIYYDDLVVSTLPIFGNDCSADKDFFQPTSTPTPQTPTPTGTQTTPTPTATTAAEPLNIVNCNFENGTTGWTLEGASIMHYDYGGPDGVHSSYSANDKHYVEQALYISANGRALYWSAWIYGDYSIEVVNTVTGNAYVLSSGNSGAYWIENYQTHVEYEWQGGAVQDIPNGLYKLRLKRINGAIDLVAPRVTLYDGITMGIGAPDTTGPCTSVLPTGIPTATATGTPSTATMTPTGPTPTNTATRTQTPTITGTPPTLTPSATATKTKTANPSITPFYTWTAVVPSATVDVPQTATIEPGPVATSTLTPTATEEPYEPTATDDGPRLTATSQGTDVATYTPWPTRTQTPIPNTATPGVGTPAGTPGTGTPVATSEWQTGDPGQQPPMACDAPCVRPGNPLALAAWMDYTRCESLKAISWCSYHSATVVAFPELVQNREPFASIQDANQTVEDIAGIIGSMDTEEGLTGVTDPVDVRRFLTPVPQQENSPWAWNGQINLIGDDRAVLSCSTKLVDYVGPRLGQSLCFAFNTLLQLGLMPLFQLFVNFATAIALYKYIDNLIKVGMA